MRIPLITIIGFVAGALVLFILAVLAGTFFNSNVARESASINYTDFISILLSAISLLMTLLAFFLAVLGFIGWNALSEKVSSKTEEFLENGFKTGEDLHKLLESKVKEVMYQGVSQVDGDAEEDVREEDPL
ncbi:hypothetical protein [Maricaulis sp.]|uniref:hypothetical protein n=1 Tax=Maricaulis sp. TaxID=1486257 RepID=UPI001B2903D4|nr:hypothetical protein [Maricaulis sp.]MBO6764060.1 hypothetical protein [Maricaulis sp.]